MLEYLFLLLFIFVSSGWRVVGDSETSYELTVSASGGEETPVGQWSAAVPATHAPHLNLLREPGQPLHLSCTTSGNSPPQLSLSWRLPQHLASISSQEQALLMSEEGDNKTTGERARVNLMIASLQAKHAGFYVCEANSSSSSLSPPHNRTVLLVVKPRKCSSEKMFLCEEDICILGSYKCDGVIDCRNRLDEAPQTCGDEPCKDRVVCKSGRCIPHEWCEKQLCQRGEEESSNCTKHPHPCCSPHSSVYSKGLPPPYDSGYSRRYDGSDSISHQPYLHYDINFIQTTIYSIIGCALIFMIIVTVLVIVICRVHLKRAGRERSSRRAARLSSSIASYHRAFTHDMTTYEVDTTERGGRSERGGLLVTYNINNGVQIVGRAVDPPPYSEVIGLPPHGGPPPPYSLLLHPVQLHQLEREEPSQEGETRSPKDVRRPFLERTDGRREGFEATRSDGSLLPRLPGSLPNLFSS